MKYCIKKAHKIVRDEPIPKPEAVASMQKVVDIFDKMYYKNKTGNENNSDEDQDNWEYMISQLDGQTDMESSGEEEQEEEIKKNVFSVNCEIREISYLMNFFRSFDCLWRSKLTHCLCESDQKESSCFFCSMRSSCLRLNGQRTKGPRNLKMLEFISQLHQYQTNFGWDWRTNDIGKLIMNTLRLLNIHESKTSTHLGFPDAQCQKCLKTVQIKNEYVFEVNTGELKSEEISMTYILKVLISRKGNDQCCLESLSLEKTSQKIMIFHFSQTQDINIFSSQKLWGKSLIYLSHIKEQQGSNSCYFRNNEDMLYQNCIGDICKSSFGAHKNVRFLAFSISEESSPQSMEALQHLVYGNQTLKYLQKKYLKNIKKSNCSKRNMKFREIKMKYENHTKENLSKLKRGKRCIVKLIKSEIRLKKEKHETKQLREKKCMQNLIKS